MARYMGPTASVAHIMQKLTIIFDTVASFNMLMEILQGHTKQPWEGSILHHKAGRNLKSDPVAVPQKDYRSRGVSRTVSFMGYENT